MNSGTRVQQLHEVVGQHEHVGDDVEQRVLEILGVGASWCGGA